MVYTVPNTVFPLESINIIIVVLPVFIGNKLVSVTGMEEKGFLPKGIKSKKDQSVAVSTDTPFLSVSTWGLAAWPVLKLGMDVEWSGLGPHACLLPPSHAPCPQKLLLASPPLSVGRLTQLSQQAKGGDAMS